MIVKIGLSLLVSIIGMTIDYQVRKLCALFSIEHYFLHVRKQEFTEEDEKQLIDDLQYLSPTFTQKARFQFNLISSLIILLQMISYTFIWLFL